MTEIILTSMKGLTDEWDEYVRKSSCPYPYLLTPFHRVLTETTNLDAIYLVAKTGTRIQGGFPLFVVNSRLLGKLIASPPYFTYGGIAADNAQIAERLLAEATLVALKHHAKFAIVRQGEDSQNLFAQVPDKYSISKEKQSIVLPLPSTEDQLWEGFKAKLRSQIKKGAKNGLTARYGKEELLRAFYSVFSRNMRDLGTPCHSVEFFQGILAHWKESWIYTVWKGDTPIGGAMLIGWKKRIEVPWASTDRRYNRLAPNMLMYSEMLKFAIQQGYHTFDFGRSTPGDGTHSFKLQWGGVARPLTWLYWTRKGAAPNISKTNHLYKIFSACWKRLPLSAANRLGPHLAKQMP